MGIYYRHLDKSTVGDCVRVINESFKTVAEAMGIEKGQIRNYGAYYTKQQLMTEVASGTGFIGAYDSESSDGLESHRMVGCIGYQIKKNGIAKLIKLGVLPEYRHHGIGTRLVFEGECRCLNHCCHTIQLGLIDENRKLKKWYQSHGYSQKRIMAYGDTPYHIAFMEVRRQHIFQSLIAFGYEIMTFEEEEDIKKLQNAITISNTQCLLIYSLNERFKKNNTGVLGQQLFEENISEFVWERGFDDELKWRIDQYMNKGYEPYLVYMDDSVSIIKKPKESIEHNTISDTEDFKLFIILDGTWQETRDMINQSAVLKALPVVSLAPDKKSNYKLRRNQREMGLCTAEVIIALMESHLTVDNYNDCDTMIKNKIKV